MKRIWGVECAECKNRLFSFHGHDFKDCGCPNGTFVDGSRNYLRTGWIKKKPRRIYWGKQDCNSHLTVHPPLKRKDRFRY